MIIQLNCQPDCFGSHQGIRSTQFWVWLGGSWRYNFGVLLGALVLSSALHPGHQELSSVALPFPSIMMFLPWSS